MLVRMKWQVFKSLDYGDLGWACIEPTIQQIRGKDFTVKSKVYAQLTTGQQGLLTFRVLYDHARNSVHEFYCWVSFLLVESKTWSEIKIGLQYFRDDAMLRFLEETEDFLEASNPQGDSERHEIRPQDLDDDWE